MVKLNLAEFVMARRFWLHLVRLRLHHGAALTRDFAPPAHVQVIRGSTCRARSVAEMASLGAGNLSQL